MIVYRYNRYVASLEPKSSPDTSANSFGMVQAEFDDHETFVEHVLETVRTHGSYL